jgi:hypothetical protein
MATIPQRKPPYTPEKSRAKVRRNRRPDHRRIRSNRSYKVADLARVLKVHTNTILINWRKRGLTPIDETRPFMFHGTTVISFLKKMLAERRFVCGPGQMACFGCRGPQMAAGDVAHFRRVSSTSFLLAAACSKCGRQMFRRGSLKYLAAALGPVHLSNPEAARTNIVTMGAPPEMVVLEGVIS